MVAIIEEPYLQIWVRACVFIHQLEEIVSCHIHR